MHQQSPVITLHISVSVLEVETVGLVTAVTVQTAKIATTLIKLKAQLSTIIFINSFSLVLQGLGSVCGFFSPYFFSLFMGLIEFSFKQYLF
jgi:uncharacterized protein YebE (UPF0316 family)